MRDATRSRSHVVLLVVLRSAGSTPVARAADEHDRYEEQYLSRSAEQIHRTATSDRAQWIKALESEFPGKVVHATSREEYDTWFTLLAGRDGVWRRSGSTPGVTALFDKVVQRQELGPVPSITRDEFARYTRRLRRDRSSRDVPNPGGDADRVFRVLDRNANGELAPEEFTAGLKGTPFRFDTDGNGRLTAEEYRGYFVQRVQTKADSLASAPRPGGTPAVRGTEPPPANGLPDWFVVLDTDNDGQVALFEWRADGRELAAFAEMDLDADGLLPPAEYRRYVKQTADKLKQRLHEERWQ